MTALRLCVALLLAVLASSAFIEVPEEARFPRDSADKHHVITAPYVLVDGTTGCSICGFETLADQDTLYAGLLFRGIDALQPYCQGLLDILVDIWLMLLNLQAFKPP